MFISKRFDAAYALAFHKRMKETLVHSLEDHVRLTNHPMRIMNTSFVPSTEKQKSMLAHQIHRAHEGAFERCLLNRGQLEEFNILNRAGKIDKDTTSQLITVIDNFVSATYLHPNPAPLIEACNITLCSLMNRIKGEEV